MWFLLASLLGACRGVVRVGAAPGLSAEQRDALQRATPRPAIEGDEQLISSVVECDLPMSPEEYMAVSRDMQLEEILVGSKNIPRVVRTEPLTGPWGPVGSRRRVVLADGNTALEELVLDQRPGLYLYEVWNFTVNTGKYIRYAVGKFEVTGDARNTHVRWTYSFRPNSKAVSGFIRRFVRGEYHDFMANGLQAIRAKAIELHAQARTTTNAE